MRYPSGVTIAPDGRVWVVHLGNSRIGDLRARRNPGRVLGHRGIGSRRVRAASCERGRQFERGVRARRLVLRHRRRRERRSTLVRRPQASSGSGVASGPSPAVPRSGMAATDQEGNVYVVDGERNVVEVFDPGGNVLRTFEANERPGTAWTMAVDSEGDIWIGTCAQRPPFGSSTRRAACRWSSASKSVRNGLRLVRSDLLRPVPRPGAEDLVIVFDQECTVARSISGGVPRSPDGMGFPWGLALDGAGNIYVSDYGAETGTTGSLKKYRLQGDILIQLTGASVAGPAKVVDGLAFGLALRVKVQSDGLDRACCRSTRTSPRSTLYRPKRDLRCGSSKHTGATRATRVKVRLSPWRAPMRSSTS